MLRPFALLILLFLFLCSCHEVNSRHEKSVTVIDSLDFRKSYAAIQFNDSIDTDSLLLNTGAAVMHPGNPVLERKLKVLGLMNKDSLITSKFKYLDSALLMDTKGRTLKLTSEFKPEESKYMIRIHDKTISDSLVFEYHMSIIEVAFADLVPGGFPEIFIVTNEYIVNGDNYYLKIYEIKE